MTKQFLLIEKSKMNPVAKNKLLTWLVILLIVINAFTIAIFWINRKQKIPQPKGAPNEFLIRELKLDPEQQNKLTALVKDHRRQVEKLRGQIKQAKDHLFDLAKESNTPDSSKQIAAAAVSKITEQIDILTLNHFQKIRILCTPEQQNKFDEIIHEVTAMMAPRPPGGPGGPPPQGPGSERPPPPGN